MATIPFVLNASAFALIGRPQVSTPPVLEGVIPPSYVFGIVWSIIYVCMGLAMAYSGSSKEVVGLTILLSLFLIMWTPTYNNGDKRDAFYIIMLSLLLAFMLYTISNRTSKLLLVPLLVWLITASKFNFVELTTD